MCQSKPGLRCAGHAQQKIALLEQRLNESLSQSNLAQYSQLEKKYQDAQFEYLLTDKGFYEYQNENPLSNDIKQLETIRVNRKRGNLKLKQHYQTSRKQYRSTPINPSNNEELLTVFEKAEEDYQNLVNNLQERLNDPHNSPDSLDALIQKTAEKQALRDESRSDYLRVAHLTNMLENNLDQYPYVQDHLEEEESDTQTIVNELATTRKLLDENKDTLPSSVPHNSRTAGVLYGKAQQYYLKSRRPGIQTSSKTQAKEALSGWNEALMMNLDTAQAQEKLHYAIRNA